MIARAFGIALFVAPIGLVVSLGGCGTRELPQDICNWLADANNCHARFANDVGQQCGYAGSRANDPIASTTGYFAARDDLSLCIKNAGGQVLQLQPHRQSLEELFVSEAQREPEAEEASA